jgi:uncharacterized protein (DUF2252 family)
VTFVPIAARKARGREVRRLVPRSGHGEWTPDPARRDPVAILEEQAATRVPELVPIRYGRMLTTPFAFFRGGAALMAADLAGRPRTPLDVQLCGDAHVSNFGGFMAPDRRVVFDVNDFDETLAGPFEWDVKRLAASLAVAGRTVGLADAERRSICLVAVESYRLAMREFAEWPALDVWYARVDVDELVRRRRGELTSAQRRLLERALDRARKRTSELAFDRLTRVVDGRPQIASNPPLVVRIAELLSGEDEAAEERALRRVTQTYRRTLPADRRRLLERFQYVDAARKVVGVGSVGTRAWIALLLARDDGDPLFLQVKEAQPSVLEPYLGRSEYDNHGRRVVEGQRLMQSASDVLLGWTRLQESDEVTRDYYVRQLWDGKVSADVEHMAAASLADYAALCGWTLARAHARSGDPIGIAAYLGVGTVFDEALAAFAESYADQNERDYDALRRAVADGRVEAATEPG